MICTLRPGYGTKKYRYGLESQIPPNLRTQLGQLIRHALHVLITPAANTDHEILSLLHGLRELDCAIDGVRRLQRRDDTLEFTDQLEASKCLSIGGCDELCALVVLPRRQLGTHAGVIETCRDGVCVRDLTVLVLEHVGAYTVKNTLGASSESSRVASSVDTVTTSLNTEKLDARIFREGVEHAYGIAATADTSDHRVWELAALLLQLGFGLVADDGLESSDDSREGMGSNSGTKDVMSGVEFHNPGSESFVNRIAQCARSGLDSNYFGAEKPYPENVQGLSSNIFLNGY